VGQGSDPPTARRRTHAIPGCCAPSGPTQTRRTKQIDYEKH
jgi:hypothetical protein